MKLSDIDLKLLRVFQAVVHARGFGKAQGTLGISQPAISAQIAKLEERLGFRLCERGPQGFALTPKGETAFRETTTLLEVLDKSADRLRDIGNDHDAPIRFGVIDCMVTDANNPLVGQIRKLKSSHPNLRVQISIHDYLDCLTELRAEQLDIAIIAIDELETIPDDLESIPLYQETSGLYCTADHPCAGITDEALLKEALAKAEISAHSFVFNPIDREFTPMLLDQSKGVAQDTIELSAYLTLSGTHVGVMPDHYAEFWVQSGTLVRLAPDLYSVTSQFHALRLQSAAVDPICDEAWRALKRKPARKG